MKQLDKTRIIGISILTFLLFAVAWVAFITEKNRTQTNKGEFLMWAVQHHTGIMMALVLIAVLVGFLWSSLLYKEVKKGRIATQNILDVVLLFLAKEEKEIINFLVENKGSTTQSEISRLPGMTRVKAYRSLQKMQEKRLIDIIPHGKVRRIKLKENILSTLNEKENDE